MKVSAMERFREFAKNGVTGLLCTSILVTSIAGASPAPVTAGDNWGTGIEGAVRVNEKSTPWEACESVIAESIAQFPTMQGWEFLDARPAPERPAPAWACQVRLPNGVVTWEALEAVKNCFNGYGDKVWGEGRCDPMVPPICTAPIGNPIIPGTLEKTQTERDDAASEELPISRTYRSAVLFGPNTGQGMWVFNWQRKLRIANGLRGEASTTLVSALREDTSVNNFEYNGTLWKSKSTLDTLQRAIDTSGRVIGWSYKVFATDAEETYNTSGQLLSVKARDGQLTQLEYDAAGKLLRIVAPSGRALSVEMDAQGHIASLTAPDNAVTRYGYDANGMLVSVTWPDGNVRKYVYEKADYPTALTGVIDEAGSRYATYGYDYGGRAISTEHAGGIDSYQFSGPGYLNTQITDYKGNVSYLQLVELNGAVLPKTLSAPCAGCDGMSKSIDYDTLGRTTRKVGFDNLATTYEYDGFGRETKRVKGAGTDGAKTFVTEWHPKWNLITRTSAPNSIETFEYDANGNLASHTTVETADANGSLGLGATPVGDAVRTEWTYDGKGHVLTTTNLKGGAVVGTWVYTYDTQGNLSTVKNPEGQIGRITQYDAAGRVLAAVTTGGIAVSYAYNPRGFVTRYTYGDNVSTYSYDVVGQKTNYTGPFGESTQYTYDAAHRLIDVQFTPDSAEALADEAPTFGARALSAISNPLSTLWAWIKGLFGLAVSDAHAQVAPPPTGAALSIGVGIPMPVPQYPPNVVDPRNSGNSPRDQMIIWTTKLIQQCGAMLRTMVSTRDSDNNDHRGRIQSQGAGYSDPGTGDVESWNQADPLTLAQGLAKLESLASRMTKAQKKKRDQAIEKARTYMLQAARAGGLNADARRTFQNDEVKKENGSERVDIEVRKGVAFVP